MKYKHQSKYKLGLVIGKFMPPHVGHIALIKFGARKCEKLIVAVCGWPEQPIPLKLRYEWMKKITRAYKNVKVVKISANLPHGKKPSHEGSKEWARYAVKRFGNIDALVSSEKYGSYMAPFMNCEDVIFDKERIHFPIHASMIRNAPKKYWHYIPNVVRPYFGYLTKT